MPSSLIRRNVIISEVAMLVRKKIKFAIALLATHSETVKLDRINGNTYLARFY